MARNFGFQVLRGPESNKPVLSDGEFYFATDTGTIYLGFFGGTLKVAHMPIQLADGVIQSQLASVDAEGDIQVDVKNFPATQAISAASPIPTTQQGGTSGLVGDVQAKGVQGTNALMVQQFQNSGRVIKTFSATFSATTTEAMVTLTPSSDGTPGSTGTSFGVTAGKRLRLIAILLAVFNTTAAIRGCQINLRMSNTGAVTTASPIISCVAASTTATTIGVTSSQAQSLPDGIELTGTMQVGISQIGIALAGQTVVLVGYEY